MRPLLRYCLLLLAINGCRDKYNSPVHAPTSGFLVVEGYISNDTAATRIHLTRSAQLDSISTIGEPGATVLIEAKTGGTTATLTEDAPGYYAGNIAAPNFSDQYRIHIITSNHKEYLSDYSSPRNTPPIDSVTWATYADGVKIYVSTHDASGQTVNYHWEYDETWKYTSAYYSELTYHDLHFFPRDSAQQIYTCYRTAGSTTVLVASTTGLARDEISFFPLADIPYLGSNRLSNNYSINVKQHAISDDALKYYEMLGKNSEQVGSIFDAQPSAVTGNIHAAADPNEPVFGFIECSAKTEKRIFISKDQLPDVGITTGHGGCEIDTFAFIDIIPQAPNTPGADSIFRTGANVPISGIADDVSISNLKYSDYFCVDCRAQGGTTTKPAFWP